jgi:hypothetical protein
MHLWSPDCLGDLPVACLEPILLQIASVLSAGLAVLPCLCCCLQLSVLGSMRSVAPSLWWAHSHLVSPPCLLVQLVLVHQLKLMCPATQTSCACDHMLALVPVSVWNLLCVFVAGVRPMHPAFPLPAHRELLEFVLHYGVSHIT